MSACAAAAVGCGEASHAQGTGSSPLDVQVRAFLDRQRGTWRDLNVPESDGRLLYDLIVKHRFTRALEIGTSTDHSGLWIAWALSKTGGRLVTIEIDPRRHRQALAHFKDAGLAAFVDVRLGDAHQLVPALDGPFDFVFSDADKEWYRNYREFLGHLETVRDGTTTIDDTSSAGISITCKTAGATGRP